MRTSVSSSNTVPGKKESPSNKKIPPIYRKLQKHLNKQAVGYPKTRDDSDIRLLQLHFPSEDFVEIALHLSFRFQSIDVIYEKTKSQFKKDILEKKLRDMAKIGCIYQRAKNDEFEYALIPLIVGLYEFKFGELTPDYIKIYEQYNAPLRFALEFISSDISQIRTIPVEKSVTPEHKIATYSQLEQLIDDDYGPFLVMKCVCRERQKILGNSCERTTREGVCLAMGTMAEQAIFIGVGKEISKQEAYELLKINQEEGLVLQTSGGQKPEFICSCCGCCCASLRLQKQVPYPAEYWTHDFHAELTTEKCIGCGNCERTCQVNAINVDKKTKLARVDIGRCIGCGNCVTVCNQQALSMVPIKNPFIVPIDNEQLFERIYSHKKGPLRKLIMGLKLIKGKHWR